ncbi:hypothetical protein [Mesorhizobium jarvisii]|uniref:hypothetical protein n=1 Tax=Mesorhizobium jarvisii TaxID=1777867 RepID=UPI001F0A2215|nr:hypothetical protein [Mesorhizobium jarvisii]MCH4559156.1 hypothetical protein [Mesorhizobium jarvisii]
MDRFIARANIAHFQDLLARETDPEQRSVIEGLLALEQKKLEIAESKARDQSRGSPRNIAKT